MDEISLFAELRPAPPADTDADAIRALVRGRITSVLSHEGPRRSPARRRVLIGGGLVAAATVAAITVPAWLPGAGDTVMAKAWAVERNSDGTITVEVSQQFNDPAGLRRSLAAYGITAFVTINREITGVNAKGAAYAYDGCDYLNLDLAPQAVESAVVTEGNNPITGAPAPFTNWTWTIDPAAMPPGSALLIPAWRSQDGTSLGVQTPTVLRTDKPPVCTPNTPPPFVRVVP
jgi:hypothetical protein